MKRILHAAFALLLLTAAAGAREITVTPYPGPAFRPGYWMVVKVALDDAANVTRIRLRNAAGGLAVEVPLAEAQSGMPVLFHRVPQKVQITLLDGERQVEQQAVPIKLTPLGKDEVSLLVITDSPTWSQQAVAALPNAPRLVGQVALIELAIAPAIVGSYTHIALDLGEQRGLGEQAKLALLHALGTGATLIQRDRTTPLTTQDGMRIYDGEWLFRRLPPVTQRPAADPHIDLDLTMAFQRPRWPETTKNLVLWTLAAVALILLAGAVLGWAIRWRWAPVVSVVVALLAAVPMSASFSSLDTTYVQGVRIYFLDAAGDRLDRMEGYVAVSTLRDTERFVDSTVLLDLAPLYYRSGQAAEDTRVLMRRQESSGYLRQLRPQQLDIYHRTVAGGMATMPSRPPMGTTRAVKGDGWLIAGNTVQIAELVDIDSSTVKRRSAPRGFGDVIDELLKSNDPIKRQHGRWLRYLRDSRRLVPNKHYFVHITWLDRHADPWWDPHWHHSYHCLNATENWRAWGEVIVVQLH